MIFDFQYPHLLWFLFLVPVLLLFRGKIGRQAAVRFPSVNLAKQVSAFVRSRPGRFSGWTRALILALVVVAFARPRMGEETSQVSSSGIDIVLAVDLSGSMWAHDFNLAGIPQDRLTVVKRVVRQFIENRKSDRIGLVAFAGEPYLVSPLTLNHEWLLERLDELEIGMIPDGTAIGSAIGTSVNRLVGQDGKSRIVILLTDGANNRGMLEPLAAAEAASALDIRVYTIGAGRDGVVPYPARFMRDGQPMRGSDGQIILRNNYSSIDLEVLKEVADKTGARYYHATDTEQLAEVYEEIDELEKTEIHLTVRRLYDDVFWIPACAALGLFCMEQLIAYTRRRRLP